MSRSFSSWAWTLCVLFSVLCAIGSAGCDRTPRKSGDPGEPTTATPVGKSRAALVSPFVTQVHETASLGASAASTYQTVGETITVPPSVTTLHTFAMFVDAASSSLVVRAYVFNWDGGAMRAFGSPLQPDAPLYASNPRTITGSGIQQLLFQPDLGVTPSGTYVLFLSVEADLAGNGDGFVGTGSGGDDYPDGGPVAIAGQVSTADWTAAVTPSPWSVPPVVGDVAFTAVFFGATTTTVTPSVNPSVVGQPVSFTAAVTGTSTPAGTVTFFDGATQLGAGPVALDVNGHATLSTSSLAFGPHSITATYDGTSDFPSTSAAVSLNVNQGATTTDLAAAPNPATVNGSVTLTSHVVVSAPASGIPTGTVTFKDAGNSIGSSVLTALSGGIAQITVPFAAPGGHSLTAEYAGDSSFSASASSPLTETVAQDTVGLGLVALPTPSAFGASVTFTLTVTSNGAGGTPTGTVAFQDGPNSLGSAVLAGTGSSASASVSTAALAGGSHTITATYSGDPNHVGGSTNILHTVNAASSTTTLASSTNPTVFGQPTTFTATVTGPGGATPTGFVAFQDGAALLGAAPLNGAAQAVLSISSLAAGPHTILATYGGDANFGLSVSAALVQTVNAAATTVTLVSSSNPALVSLPITFTANVSATAPGAGTVGGTVVFKDGATVLGSGPVSGGVASFTTSALTAGSHSMTATYSGSASFAGATSAPLTQVMNQSGVQVNVVAAPNPATFGATVTLTATITASPATTTPTGTVTFSDGATSVGSSPLTGGTPTSAAATFTIATLTGGAHSIVAAYGGDGNHASGSSGGVIATINPTGTTTALAASPNGGVFGQSTTLTATVTSPIAGTLTGSITFREGTTVLGTATLAAGAAALTQSFTAGSHTVTATYSGDGNFATSTSTGIVDSIGKADTTTLLTSSSNPSLISTNVTFSATVAPVAPGAGVPTGNVTFKDGTSVLGTAALSNNGVATFGTTALAPGTHTITAEYAGSSNQNGSTSAALTQKVNTEAATVSLTAAPEPSTYGQAVLFSARLAGAAGTPTGTVVFKELLGGSGTSTLGSTTLNGTDTAQLSIATLPAGTHNVVAEYAGDAIYAVASGATAHFVDQAPTRATLASSANPSTTGDAVVLTATIGADASGFTGNVEFFDGSRSLGTAPLNGSTATFSATNLTIGGHAMIATYSGDVNFKPSTATAITQTVNPATPNGTTPSGSSGTIDGGAATVPASAEGGGCAFTRTPPESFEGGTLVAAALALLVRRRPRSRGHADDPDRRADTPKGR